MSLWKKAFLGRPPSENNIDVMIREMAKKGGVAEVSYPGISYDDMIAYIHENSCPIWFVQNKPRGREVEFTARVPGKNYLVNLDVAHESNGAIISSKREVEPPTPRSNRDYSEKVLEDFLKTYEKSKNKKFYAVSLYYHVQMVRDFFGTIDGFSSASNEKKNQFVQMFIASLDELGDRSDAEAAIERSCNNCILHYVILNGTPSEDYSRDMRSEISSIDEIVRWGGSLARSLNL